MADRSEFRPNLNIFGVPREDPGFVYVVRNGDLLKIGKSVDPKRRIQRDAKTWLPDIEIIGIKPFWNMTEIEHDLHIAFTEYWYNREWFLIPKGSEEAEIIDQFKEFYEDDRDMNSVDFIYWMNSSGMSEWCIEMTRQTKNLSQFRRAESRFAKKE